MFHLDDFISSWPWTLIAWCIHLILLGLVSAHCLQRRRESTSALLWIVIAWSIPVFGAVVYLIFGVDRVHDKGFQKHLADQRLLAARKSTVSLQKRVIDPPDSFSKDINRAMDSMFPDHLLMGGNEIVPLVDGDEAFPQMMEAIRKAEHSINLVTFIIDDDEVGRSILDLLAAKARAGVTVRVLYDRFGSTYALWRGLFRRYRNIKNLSLIGWTQANPLKRQFQVNLRNHRKIMVVDGKHAFIGGINLHNAHIT
ncbi:MAG: phospholipase D-like domain-containing protein, partial [bacterium]